MRVFTDAAEMLRQLRPEVVAIATNTKGRAGLTCLAVEHGAKMILTDKPMCHTLAEADRMVRPSHQELPPGDSSHLGCRGVHARHSWPLSGHPCHS